MKLPGDEKRVERICLRCDKPFSSRSRFNRLCDACRKANHALAGRDMADNPPRRRGNNGAGRDI